MLFTHRETGGAPGRRLGKCAGGFGTRAGGPAGAGPADPDPGRGRGFGQVRSSAGTEDRAASMAWARARADSAVSSTATRAAGAWPGLREAMLRVCLAGART